MRGRGPESLRQQAGCSTESQTWSDVAQLWPGLSAPSGPQVEACSPRLGRGPAHLRSKGQAAGEGLGETGEGGGYNNLKPAA